MRAALCPPPPLPPAQAQRHRLWEERVGDRPVQRPQQAVQAPLPPSTPPSTQSVQAALTDGPGLIRPCLPEAN